MHEFHFIIIDDRASCIEVINKKMLDALRAFHCGRDAQNIFERNAAQHWRIRCIKKVFFNFVDINTWGVKVQISILQISTFYFLINFYKKLWRIASIIHQ